MCTRISTKKAEPYALYQHVVTRGARTTASPRYTPLVIYKGGAGHMIINEDAYQMVYNAMPLGDSLIDSWFLSEEAICCFNLPQVTRASLVDDVLYRVVSATKMAMAAADIFTLSEAALLVHGSTAVEFLYQPLLMPVEDMRDMSAGERWAQLASALRDAPLGKTRSLFLEFTYALHVHTAERAITQHGFQSALALQIYCPRADHDGYIASQFSLSTPIWSIMRPQNDVDVMLIYLLSQGLVTTGTAVTAVQTLQQFLDMQSIKDIVAAVTATERIVISQDQYEDYDNCVLVLPEEGDMKLCGNRELAALNRPGFFLFLQEVARYLDQGVPPLLVPL